MLVTVAYSADGGMVMKLCAFARGNVRILICMRLRRNNLHSTLSRKRKVSIINSKACRRTRPIAGIIDPSIFSQCFTNHHDFDMNCSGLSMSFIQNTKSLE